MNGKKSILFLFSFLVLGLMTSNAQDPNRFNEEINELISKEYHFDNDSKLVVFAGSSSIRKWNDVNEYFPKYNIINYGFGGSHFSDLLYFYNEIIISQTPDILFIYEGDNDVASKKKTGEIYKDAKTLIKKIQRDLPSTKIVLISPKPSIARWHLKNQYEKINKKLKKLCMKTEGVEYADVWKIMLDKNGIVYKDIFMDDNIHMNKKGYDLWAEVIGEFLE